MKFIQASIIALILIYGSLLIGQIWFDFISGDIFSKITWTFTILFILVITVYFVKKYFLEEQSLKKDKYID